MPVSFVRALGRQPGVQLNPLIDASELNARTIADQTFAMPLRAERGRIDRAITVNRNNVVAKLGKAGTIRANALNEAWAQLYEGLSVSGGSAVVARMVQLDQAVIKWVTVGVTPGAAAEDPSTYDFGVSETKATADYLVQIKHLGCHNDGIKVALWAEPSYDDSNTEIDTKWIKVRIKDADDGILLVADGSTDPTETDAYGRSLYLPDVIRARSDEFECEVIDDAVVKPVDPIYGYTDGLENWSESDILEAFTEGGTAYTEADYQDAVGRLEFSTDSFAYLSSGGSQTSLLLSNLATLAHRMNVQLRYDVDGSLGVDAAIAFVDSVGFYGAQSAHLMHAFWMPVTSNDRSGVNPNGYIGSCTLNVALACARNASRNAQGLAAKNYPIAGRRHPVPRTGLRQQLRVTEGDLNKLARAKINPVVFDTFSGGSFCVFRDQITQAPTGNSLRMLISVVDMSTSIDDDVVRFGKDLINAYPMSMAVKRMRDFLEQRFSAATTSGWLVPAPDLDGETYTYSVAPNPDWPYDKMDVRYSLRFDGAVRQIEVTQTLSR